MGSLRGQPGGQALAARPLYGPRSAANAASSRAVEYLGGSDAVAAACHAASTVGSYARSVRRYLLFCRDTLELHPYGDDGCPIHLLAHCFAWHLIQQELAISTVRGYLCAVVDHLIEIHVIVSRHAFYSPALLRLLKGWLRLRSLSLGNERLRCKIELTALLYSSMRSIALSLESNPSFDPVLVRAASLAVGMTLHSGFRPSEVMNPYGTPNARCYLRAGSSSFLLPDGSYVPTTAVETLPASTVPVAFVTLLPTKADQTGRNGPRAFARNPDTSPGAFCLVRDLFIFLRLHTPSDPTEGIFAASTRSKTALLNMVRDLYRRTAIHNGLDPSRLVPHSGRVGHVAMLITAGFDGSVICLSGGWRSAKGVEPYMRSAVHLSQRTVKALCDTHAIALEDQKHMYNTPDIRG